MRLFSGLFIGIGLLVFTAACSASGALVGQVSNGGTNLQSYVNNIMPFNSVSYDDFGFFDPKMPTRLTVPAGVSRVKLTFSAETSFSINPYSAHITVLKNGQFGSGIPGMGIQVSSPSVNPQVMATTAWIPVQPGDYFELAVIVGVSGVHTSDYTWLAIEAQ